MSEGIFILLYIDKHVDFVQILTFVPVSTTTSGTIAIKLVYAIESF